MNTSDAYGQAALLLCETLIHLLIEKNVLTLDEVYTALEGVEEIAHEMMDKAPIKAAKSTLTLLQAIQQSLQYK